MSFDENNIIFKQYFIPDKYDKSLIFSKTLQDYIAGIQGLNEKCAFVCTDKFRNLKSDPVTA